MYFSYIQPLRLSSSFKSWVCSMYSLNIDQHFVFLWDISEFNLINYLIEPRQPLQVGQCDWLLRSIIIWIVNLWKHSTNSLNQWSFLRSSLIISLKFGFSSNSSSLKILSSSLPSQGKFNWLEDPTLLQN